MVFIRPEARFGEEGRLTRPSEIAVDDEQVGVGALLIDDTGIVSGIWVLVAGTKQHLVAVDEFCLGTSNGDKKSWRVVRTSGSRGTFLCRTCRFRRTSSPRL